MKKTYKYIALAAIALSAVACSQEDLTSSYLSDSKAVHISAQIGTNDNVTGGFQSRSNPLGGTAEEQAKFNIGDQISVATGSQSAVTYTLGEDETWIPETSKYLVWSSDNMYFTAYYPVGKNNASATTFTVPSGYANVKDLADADYMTYFGEQSNADGNGVTLPMERKMVRLVINTTFGNQYESGYEVSSIKIHSNSTGYADKDKVQSGNKEVTAYKHSDGKFYALLAPTSADASAAFLTVTVNGIAEELTVKGVPATLAGYSYEMNLTVGKDKASVKSVKVSDWKNGTIAGGTADEVASVDANSHTVVTAAENQLNDALLSEALGNGNMLVIEGPLASQDISIINTFIKNKKRIISLDMAKAEIETIPESAFESNAYLGKTKLPTKLKVIGRKAFMNSVMCTIENFNVLENLETIGSYAFTYALLNQSIVIPQTIKSVGESSFQLTGITSIRFPSNISSVGGVIANCHSLTSVIFDGDIKSFSVDNVWDSCIDGCVIDFSQTNSVPEQPIRGPLGLETSDNYDNVTGKLKVKFIVKKGLKNAYEAHDCWKYCTIEEAK